MIKEHVAHMLTTVQKPMSSDQVLEAVVRRIKLRYMRRPSLALTPLQASRLLGLDEDVCEALMSVLVGSGFLRRTTSGAFERALTH